MEQQEVKLTDSEKIDAMFRRQKRMEISTHTQTLIMIATFFGIISIASIFSEVKNITNGKIDIFKK